MTGAVVPRVKTCSLFKGLPGKTLFCLPGIQDERLVDPFKSIENNLLLVCSRFVLYASVTKICIS